MVVSILLNQLKVRAPGFWELHLEQSLVYSTPPPPAVFACCPLLPHISRAPSCPDGSCPESSPGGPESPADLAHAGLCLSHSTLSPLGSKTPPPGVSEFSESFLLLRAAPIEAHRPSLPNTCLFCVRESRRVTSPHAIMTVHIMILLGVTI